LQRAQRHETSFRLISAALLLAAAYHIGALLVPSLNISSPPWHHALFAALSVFGTIFILRRPPWFVFLFGAVTMQQLCSHGERAWRWWLSQGRVDWISLIVFIWLPCALELLALD
jgi:hypothetical protein